MAMMECYLLRGRQVTDETQKINGIRTDFCSVGAAACRMQ